jgi:hypothetical protein
LVKENADLRERDKSVVMRAEDLMYQQYISGPPATPMELYDRACAGDKVTTESWKDTWFKNLAANRKRFDFEAHSVYQEYGKHALKPGIIVGAGPSLKRNAMELKNRGDISVSACLHTFGFLEDNGVPADYYLNLDPGDVTIPEMAEGGGKNAEHYWDLTKDRTLVTATVGNPDLIAKWKGRVLFFGTCAPEESIVNDMGKAGDVEIKYSVGGNTLGACLYHARSLLGCCPQVFIGADFSFSYDKHFHSWSSGYDAKYAGLTPCTDIYGHRVQTWGSYFGFKCWTDSQACGGKGNVPTMFINCTEGGILGAYPEGNIMQIRQMGLRELLYTYNFHKLLPETLENNRKHPEKPMLLF